MYIAPPDITAPTLKKIESETSAIFRLYSASKKHGPIIYYYVVVVQSDLAEQRLSESFTTPEVLALKYFSILS